jgi:hypothetical protein
MKKRIGSSLGAALIVVMLLWDFIDGFKGQKSMLAGFCSLIGGVVSFVTMYWTL